MRSENSELPAELCFNQIINFDMKTLSLEFDKLIGVIGDIEHAAVDSRIGAGGSIGQSRIGGVDF